MSDSMHPKSNTISFYDENATAFIENTFAVDMTSLYEEFLPLLSPRSHILDAGCGSGRDSKYFIESGFRVTAIDASRALATEAANIIGQPVQHCLFQDFKSDIRFDAIWACASLLHVSSVELPFVFKRLANLLTPDGKFYCSFKYGVDDVERAGRYFTNADEKRLRQFITGSTLQIEKTWLTGDLRPERRNECWLNAILSHAK